MNAATPIPPEDWCHHHYEWADKFSRCHHPDCAEKDAPTCDHHCGAGATHEGYAYPAGGSFPVTGCERCLEGLARDFDVEVRPIQGGSVCTCGHTAVAHVRSGPCRLCSCNDTRAEVHTMTQSAESDAPGLRGIAALGEDAEALGLTEISVEELLKEMDAHDALTSVIYRDTEELEAVVYEILTDDQYAEGVDPFELSRVIVRSLLPPAKSEETR